MSRHLLVSLLSVLAACGAQVDGDFPGETLALVSGTLTGNVDTTGPLRVSLAWQIDGVTDRDVYYFGQDAAVTPGFPARYSVSVHQVPPEWAYFDFNLYLRGEPRVAIGVLVAYSGPDVTEAIVAAEQNKSIIGASNEHYLVFAEDAVVAGSLAAVTLGGPVPKGFSLCFINRPDSETDQMVPVPMETPVPIRFDTIENLDVL